MYTPARNESGIIPSEDDFWESETDRLLDSMEQAGMPVRLIYKEGDRLSNYEKWWERAAMRFVRRFLNKEVITGYIQAFSDGSEVRIYFPDERSPRSMDMHSKLRHECVHALQAYRVLGRYNWLGALLFAIAYVLVLPLVFTMRSKYESEAYQEELRVYGFAGRWDIVARMIPYYRRQFTSSQYGWMDPIWGGGFKEDGKVMRSLRNNTFDVRDTPLSVIGFRPSTRESDPPPPNTAAISMTISVR